MTLRGIVHDLYAPLRGLDDRTVRIYEFTLKAFAKHLGKAFPESPTVDDLEELKVARFLSTRLRERAIGTAAKDRATLHALWEFSARRGLTNGRWPAMRTIRVPERVPVCWTTDEMRRLLEAAGEEHGTISGVPAGLWWRAIVLTGYDVGERIGGLLGIEWPDVSRDGIIFRAEVRKGKTRDIFRPISPECHAAIEAIKTQRKLVFAWDRCYTSLWGRLGKICERAGLPNDRGAKFHRIRKTTASYAAAAGLDPQRLLDHSSPVTTRRYLDPRVVTQASAPSVLPKITSSEVA